MTTKINGTSLDLVDENLFVYPLTVLIKEYNERLRANRNNFRNGNYPLSLRNLKFNGEKTLISPMTEKEIDAMPPQERRENNWMKTEKFLIEHLDLNKKNTPATRKDTSTKPHVQARKPDPALKYCPICRSYTLLGTCSCNSARRPPTTLDSCPSLSELALKGSPKGTNAITARPTTTPGSSAYVPKQFPGVVPRVISAIPNGVSICQLLLKLGIGEKVISKMAKTEIAVICRTKLSQAWELKVLKKARAVNIGLSKVNSIFRFIGSGVLTLVCFAGAKIAEWVEICLDDKSDDETKTAFFSNIPGDLVCIATSCIAACCAAQLAATAAGLLATGIAPVAIGIAVGIVVGAVVDYALDCLDKKTGFKKILASFTENLMNGFKDQAVPFLNSLSKITSELIESISKGFNNDLLSALKNPRQDLLIKLFARAICPNVFKTVVELKPLLNFTLPQSIKGRYSQDKNVFVISGPAIIGLIKLLAEPFQGGRIINNF